MWKVGHGDAPAMSFNLRLGYGMAQVYGFTNIRPQGVYYPRHLMQLPSVPYCFWVLKQARERKVSNP